MGMVGFDKDAYLTLQSEAIKKRIAQFGGKLYLEFGGKLFDDHHAARVLPGFSPDTKVNMLLQLKEQAEIVIVINAGDIEKNKVRGDLGITYDLEALRLIDAFRAYGFFVGSVVITQFSGQFAAERFKTRLEQQGIQVYVHYPIAGYPSDVAQIVSPEGFGKDEYVETERPLVVLTAPGPGSGKMSVCLSNLYQDHVQGKLSGYAKFETFPVWNLPLAHPVNIAYEAATADLDDANMIDPFHLEAYGETAVSYNRDIEVFPVLETIFERIWGASPYKSPTDMGVNMVGKCIEDKQAVEKAAKQEIIRRYYAALCSNLQGFGSKEQITKIELLLKRAQTGITDRPVVTKALERAEKNGLPAAAVQMPDGEILAGKDSPLLGAASATLLNCLKYLAGLDDKVLLISPEVLAPVQKLKSQHLGTQNPRLGTQETLIALAISAVTDPKAKAAMNELSNLAGLEIHSTVILSAADESVFRKLGMHLTCQPQYETQKLYQR